LLAESRITIPSAPSDVQYHFQLRASRTGPGVRELAGGETSGGGGFMAMLGDMPLRLRLRMDGDFFPAASGKQAVWTAGLGAEAVYRFPDMDTWKPFVSLGPAFQRWEIGSDTPQGLPKRSFNKLAGRAESGFWYKERVCLSLGLLWGRLESGRSTSNPYAAVTFRF
jgi:hypothetical protein